MAGRNDLTIGRHGDGTHGNFRVAKDLFLDVNGGYESVCFTTITLRYGGLLQVDFIL